MNINLEHYRTFYYVGKMQNMSLASEILCVSQPAISRTIKKLEEELCCKLFERAPHGVKMTKEGEKLYQHVSVAFSELLLGEQNVRRLSAHEPGVLNIGATESEAVLYLIPKIREFRKIYPNITVHFQGSNKQRIISDLKHGDIEIAVISEPFSPSQELSCHKVRILNDVFIAGGSFSQLRDHKVSLQEITECPLLTMEKGSSENEISENWFSSQGAEFHPDFIVQTQAQALALAENGMGVGIMPYQSVRQYIEEGRIFSVSTEKPFSSRNILLIYNNNMLRSVARSAFISFLLDI